MSDDRPKPRCEKAFLVMRLRRVDLLPQFSGASITSTPAAELNSPGEFFADVLSHEAENFDVASSALLEIIMRRPDLEWARPWVDPSPQQVIGSRLPLHDAIRHLVEGTQTAPKVAEVIGEFERTRAARRAEWLAQLTAEREGK